MHLLAPQSGALRRGAFRDFHSHYPIPIPSTYSSLHPLPLHPLSLNPLSLHPLSLHPLSLHLQQWTTIRGATCISDAVFGWMGTWLVLCIVGKHINSLDLTSCHPFPKKLCSTSLYSSHEQIELYRACITGSSFRFELLDLSEWDWKTVASIFLDVWYWCSRLLVILRHQVIHSLQQRLPLCTSGPNMVPRIRLSSP